MRRVLTAMAAILLSCNASYAQSAPSVSTMGPTSPLGLLGSSAPNAGAGIPLGATEIDSAGLSPGPVSACNTNGLSSSATAGSSGAGMTAPLGANSTFDASGLAAPSSCSSASADPTSTGTASPLSIPGTQLGQTVGGTIPLGATEIDSAGVSPLIGVPLTGSAAMPSGTSPCIANPTTSASALPSAC
jgi:hypothetical protein